MVYRVLREAIDKVYKEIKKLSHIKYPKEGEVIVFNFSPFNAEINNKWDIDYYMRLMSLAKILWGQAWTLQYKRKEGYYVLVPVRYSNNKYEGISAWEIDLNEHHLYNKEEKYFELHAHGENGKVYRFRVYEENPYKLHLL